MMKVRFGDIEFEVAVADDDRKRSIGLSKLKELPKGKGLLMKFESKTTTPIRMSDMKFPLDLVFMADSEVLDIIGAKDGAEDIQPKKPYTEVLEINAGEAKKLKTGTKMSVVGIKNEDGTVTVADGGIAIDGNRQVLDEDGKNQANLLGEERIFSRADTAKFFKYAAAKDYKKLGLAVVDAITRQDTQEVEYAKN